MKVGIDARLLNVPHIRGTGRYIFELLRHTEPEDEIDWTPFAHDPAHRLFVPSHILPAAEVFDFRGYRFHFWEQIGLPSHVRRKGIQVLHCADNTAPIWQTVPTVVTIHDTVIWTETTPGTLEHFYFHRVQDAALRRCAAVVTISESSRRDIIARWPYLEDRLVVIPHGVADEFFEKETGEIPKDIAANLQGAPYLIYVGGPHSRKRFDWAVELLRLSEQSHLHLVACGFSSGTAPVGRIPANLRTRIHFAPFVSDAQLAALYRAATAAVYPSTYEGFGFPAIEAQASGTPVIFSPVTSLAELVGPMAYPVEVHNMGGWISALHAILAMSGDERSERALRATRWASGFSWRKSAQRHVALYREVQERFR